MDASIEAKPTYYAGLPSKRVGAGLVCRDTSGRVLLVRPTYKPSWEIPGGVVEADESPAAAVAREVREELGAALFIGRLLVVDWIPAQSPKTEGLMFLFDGGVLDAETTRRFVLPEDELREWMFAEPDQLAGRVTGRMARRLTAALVALKTEATRYLEAGEEVSGPAGPL
jgi:ADP-ribose pyrophosphatase YjhB (NUDIX family)